MNKVLLDTSVIIDFLRRKDKTDTLLFSLVQDKYQLSVSTITQTELYAGKSVWEEKQAAEELETLFSGIDILPLNEKISKKAGEIRARYNINLLDAIVAATAIVYKLKLVSSNVKDFEKIDQIKLLVTRLF